MIGRRRGLVAAALGGVAIGLAALVLMRLPGATDSPPSSPGPSSTHAAPTPRADDATVRSFAGPPLLPGPPVKSIGRATQSRLWSIDGTWYGVVVDPATREARIGVLASDGRTWADSGVLIDDRPGAMVDALWDGTVLVTISAVPGRSQDNAVRVARFRADETGRFVRDANYPIPLTERGVTAATIARDGAGRLWAAFVQDGTVLVAHTSTDDAIWSAPSALPGSGPVGEDDLAAVVATGDGRVALAWSDLPQNAVRLALRRDEAPPEAWDEPETVFDDLPLGPRPISVAAADGTVAIGIQTAVASGAGVGPSDPDSLIAVRDAAGSWRTALTSRVSDRLGSPIVALDPAGGYVYAFLTSPRRAGVVYLKRSPLQRLDFPSGRGLLAIDDPDAHPEVTSVTTAKSPVSLGDTFVIQGLDEATGIPWHAVIGPPAGASIPSASPGTGSPTPQVSPSPRAGARVLVDDDFAPWAAGDPITNGWDLRPADATGTLVAAGDTPDARHARLRSASSASIRACKSFPLATDGDLVVDLAVQAESIGPADVVITSIRSGANESASVRFGQGGTFAYYAGATKVRTTAANRLGRWLHSRVTVHLDTATYDWRLTDSDGTGIVTVRDIPFRESVDGASSVCIGTSAGPGRPVVRFDDVRVAH